MRRAIRKHLRDALAILGLFVVAGAVAWYILDHQRLRFPWQESPFRVNVALANAAAVTPGQGQTVQVAGVMVGRIGDVTLKDGRAVVALDLFPRFHDLVHRDATALLRPRTGLKDMFIQIDPGTPSAPLVDEGFTIPVRNSSPTVDVDQILSELDADTRDYVRLLIHGGARGLRGRGQDLAELFRRLGPTLRDLGRVNRAVGHEHDALKRVITALADVNSELAVRNGNDLAQLVDASAATFRALASEDRNVSLTVHRLPGALRQASDTLQEVRGFAEQLGPATRRLVPAVQALNRANPVVRRTARKITPTIRDRIRPFVRQARPLVGDLRAAARPLAKATPDLTQSMVVLNHLFNMLGNNPNGREGPDQADRDEGYLFWLAWLSHETINLVNIDDANGPMRPIFLTGTCSTLTSLVNDQPALEFAQNLTPVLTEICGNPKTLSVDLPAVKKLLARAKTGDGSGG